MIWPLLLYVQLIEAQIKPLDYSATWFWSVQKFVVEFETLTLEVAFFVRPWIHSATVWVTERLV